MVKGTNCQLLELQYFLGNKWTFPLLFELKSKRATFNQLKMKTNKRINSTLLSKTLKNFKKFNIVGKVHKDKIYYELTDNGKKLVNILSQLKEWGIENDLVLEKCKDTSCTECGVL